MPLGLNFKRKLASSSRTFSVQIRLLDNTVIDVKLPQSAKGWECIGRVTKSLGVDERQYFGLQYVNRKNVLRWVDPDKNLRKQLDRHGYHGGKGIILLFKVKFFVPNCESLHQEITRYQYYLELKSSVTNGNLRCDLETALQLASFAVQAEFGDYDEEKHTLEFMHDFVLLPAGVSTQMSLEELNVKISALHKNHRGMSPSSAELAYLRECQQLEDYGIEYFSVKDKHGQQLKIGASFLGIQIKEPTGEPPKYFQWQNIANMAYNRHFFCIENEKTGETIQFDAGDIGTAKYVWKMCVAQHQFYRLSYTSAGSPTFRSQDEYESQLPSGSPVIRGFQRKPTLPRRSAKRSRLGGQESDGVADDDTPRLNHSSLTGEDERDSPGHFSWQSHLEAEGATNDDSSSTPGRSTPASSGYNTSDSETESDTSSRVHPVAVGPLRLAALQGLGSSSTDFRRHREPESRDQLLRQLERVVQDDQIFVEFEQIFVKKLNGNVSTGSLVINAEKNRTKDVLPYEENRVQLDATKNANQNDYINASSIKVDVGKGQSMSFIATQTPLPITVRDFWQMVWEQNVKLIVMTTNDEKSQKVRSCHYWPEDAVGAKVSFEEFQVTTQFVNSSEAFTTRGLKVLHARNGEDRTIIQLQFLAWPDGGIPDDAHEFLTFLDEVRSLRQSLHDMEAPEHESNVVVHCSSGAGRTGVFILCEVLIAMIDNNQFVDVPMILARLRSQRMHMVQTVAQYGFVYAVVLTYLKRNRLI